MISQQVRQRTVPRRQTAITAMFTLLLTLALMVVAGATGYASDGTNRSGASRPTIVLVHGGWAGPESWSRVATRLNNDGFATVTPTLALDSLAGDVATVREALDGIPGKKVL